MLALGAVYILLRMVRGDSVRKKCHIFRRDNLNYLELYTHWQKEFFRKVSK